LPLDLIVVGDIVPGSLCGYGLISALMSCISRSICVEFLSLNHILPVFIALAGATVIAAVVNFFGARRALGAQ
jgi:hypothetical protein